jgi:hypothetical protein
MEKKQDALRAIYEAMDTEEIVRRLAGGQLAAVAAETAREELTRRRSPAEAPRKRPATQWQVGGVAAVAVAVALVVVASYFLLSRGLFFIILFAVVLPGMAAFIGKAFPALGYVLGGALLATPLWLGAWIASDVGFGWRGGDFNPIGSLFIWAAYFVASVLGLLIGWNFVRGARHKERRQDLDEEIAAER